MFKNPFKKKKSKAPSPPPPDDDMEPPSDDEVPPPSDDEAPPPSDDEAPPVSDDEAPPPSDDEAPPPSDEDLNFSPPDAYLDHKPTGLPPRHGSTAVSGDQNKLTTDVEDDLLDALSSGLKLGGKVSAKETNTAPSDESVGSVPSVHSQARALQSNKVKADAVENSSNTRKSLLKIMGIDNPPPSAAVNGTNGTVDGNDQQKNTKKNRQIPTSEELSEKMRPIGAYRSMSLALQSLDPRRPTYDECNFDQSDFKKIWAKFIADPAAAAGVGEKAENEEDGSNEIDDEFEPIRILISKEEALIYIRLGHESKKVESRSYPDANGNNDDISVSSGVSTNSVQNAKKLYRHIPEGEGVGDITFDLNQGVYISLVVEDKACFRLRHNTMDIIFKTDSVTSLQRMMNVMPPCVFDAPPTKEAAKVKNKTKIAPTVIDRRPSPPPKFQRKKYTSVEDILEGNDGDETANIVLTKDGTAIISSGKPNNSRASGPPSLPPPPPDIDSYKSFEPPVFPPDDTSEYVIPSEELQAYVRRRKELVDSHINKPKYSIHHVTQLCNWLNALALWPRKITIFTLHKEFCSGVFLAKLMQSLVPGTKYIHLNEKPASKKPAIENLEQALGVIWRSKCVNNSRIATANEIYNGNTHKIAIMLQEIFEVYVKAPLYKNAVNIMRWYHSVLKQYQLPIPEEVFTEGDLSGIWPLFQSGVAIFCLFYHYYGPIAIGEGSSIVRIDPLRIVSDPARISDFRANISYCFSLMRAVKIPIIWEAEAWISFPDTESIILQLTYIYDNLKNRQCSLTPAQGSTAGLTAGANGEMLVVGLVFADSRPINSATFQRKHKTVLLGCGKDSLPMLPIDIPVENNNRFYKCGVAPKGLVNSDVRLVYTPIISAPGKRAISERTGWNPSGLVESAEERISGSKLLRVLRTANAEESNFGITGIKTALNSPKRPTANKYEIIEEMKRKHKKEQEKRLADQQHNVSVAMSNLEKAMNDSDKDIEMMEIELEQEYLYIENNVTHMSKEEVNKEMSRLDARGVFIEEEKCRLQEHFALCLSSIRAQYQEESARINALADEEAKQIEEIMKKQQKTVTIPSKVVKKRVEEENQQKNAILEKKWISQTRDMNNKTFNYHLQRKQTESMVNLQSRWEPPKVKARKALEENNQNQSNLQSQLNLKKSKAPFSPKKAPINTVVYSASKVAKVLVPSSVELKVDPPMVAFEQFKLKLKHDTEQFYEQTESMRKSQAKAPMAVEEINNNASNSSPTKKKIPLVYHTTASSASKRNQQVFTNPKFHSLSSDAGKYNFEIMTPPKKSIHVKATKNENEKMKGGAIANSNDSTSGQSNGINMNLPWNEIKKHEILCMTYEDDRRRLFLQQQIEQERLNHQRKHEEQLKKVEMQQKIQMQMLSYAKANTNQQNSIRSIRAVPATNHFENDEDFEVYRHQHSSNTSINEDDEDFPDFEAEEENKSVSDGMDTDVNSAIAALSQRQILYMVGRRDVAYEWCVNSILTTNNSNEEEEVSDYELTWYKNGMKEGCVSLLDILSIELGPGTGSNQAAMADLVCHIAVSNSTHSNPRALKKSGGRPIISIRFPNSSDCKLFSKQLELLRQILL